MTKPIQSSIDRRGMLKNSAALGISAALFGCQAKSTASAEEQLFPERTELRPEKPESTHRIYKVELQDGVPLHQIHSIQLGELHPRPRVVQYDTAARRGFLGGDKSPPKQDILIWCKASAIPAIQENKDIKSVTPFLATSVVELGDVKEHKGKLGVNLFLSPERVFDDKDKERTFQTAEEIVAEWQEKLGDIPGVSIKAVTQDSNRQPKAIDMVALPGMAVIEFDGDQLDAKIINLIKSHPQTIAIKWGDLFRYFYCPGCGMG